MWSYDTNIVGITFYLVWVIIIRENSITQTQVCSRLETLPLPICRRCRRYRFPQITIAAVATVIPAKSRQKFQNFHVTLPHQCGKVCHYDIQMNVINLAWSTDSKKNILFCSAHFNVVKVFLLLIDNDIAKNYACNLPIKHFFTYGIRTLSALVYVNFSKYCFLQMLHKCLF
jgi:hypothetical protein